MNVKGSASKYAPNKHLIRIICSVEQDKLENVDAIPRTELDSHANMAVVGRHSFIFESTGRTCHVTPFSPDLGVARDVPIVDAAIGYDDEVSGTSVLLLLRNALYMPTMTINLIPPFLMRCGGVIVNDVAKIHCDQPTTLDHCISFRNHELTIPLKLNGIFSYFNHRTPTAEEIEYCDKFFITPDAIDWNPYCDSFSKNEDALTDSDGRIIQHHVRDEFNIIAYRCLTKNHP